MGSQTLRTFSLIALLLLVIGGSTLLYCDSPGRTMSAESRPPISSVARWLTVPVGFANASELRVACLPIAAGLMWLVLAATGTQPPHRVPPSPTPNLMRFRRCFATPLNQLVTLTVATLVIAVISAFVNEAWPLSRGWCFYVACGAMWAVGLATAVGASPSSGLPRMALAMIALVAIGACGLTFWHREVLGIQYVRWPIGPLTITGSMAGVWAAMAIGLIAGAMVVRPHRGLHLLAALPVLVLTGMLVYVAGRRGSALGMASAVAACAFVIMLTRLPARTARLAVGAGVFAFVIAVGGWLAFQMKSPVREVSGSIALREAYYGSAARLIGQNPVLGIGPDMTICRVTTDLARERAEHPHVIHGNTVPALHNEWLQAVLELGLVGGLLYLAIPVAVLLAGARALLRTIRSQPTPAGSQATQIVCLFSSLAGLTAIVVIEATSINLRGPVMSALYWTLIGLSVGLAQLLSQHTALAIRDAPKPAAESDDRVNEKATSQNRPSTSRMPQFIMAGLGGLILLLTFGNLQRTYAHTQARALRATDPTAAVQTLDLASDRFGAEHWLAVRVDRGGIESEVSRELRRAAASTPPSASQPAPNALAAEWTAAAIATWEQLLRRCAGYPGAGGFLGEALIGAGRNDDARSIFEGYLSEMDPYDQAANLMYAVAFTNQPLERINLVRRGLRAGAVEPIGRRMFLQALTEPGVAEKWAAQVAIAIADAESGKPDAWQDPLAPETLRLEAIRLMSKGELGEASRIQDMAANIYDRLYQSNHPLRRAAPAEIDAWKIAADVRFESDPVAYRAALERVLVAERFAVLSVEHEYRRDPSPDAEFVGGVVTPVETPDSLVPLWRLSAKLHIAADRTKPMTLLPRLHHALTNAQREAIFAQGMMDAAAQQLQFKLITELFGAFQRVPAERRPPAYDQWADILRRATAATQPARSP